MAAAVGALLLALALAPEAGAQSDPAPTPTATAVESAPAPTPVPTAVAEPEAAATSQPPVEPQTRVDAVPKADEDASSDRIRYRDPLDIDYEPVKDKWERFEQSLLGITRYSFFDDKVRFRIGFRFQADGTLVTPSDDLEANLGEMEDRADFRRLRLFAEGILGTMYFRAEFDFATDAGLKTVYLEGRKGGLEIWGHLLGKFRYGYFQEPFSLEKNLSSFDTAFAEVSLPIDAMGPGSNLGAMVYDASSNRRFTWAAGAFSWGSETNDNASSSLLSLSGRFGYQPLRYNEGRRMLHLGLSISSRSPTGDAERFRARPEARFVKDVADTGNIPTYTNTLLGLEAAWKGGSSWAQAEWVQSRLDSPETENPHFGGIALQAGTFLTGQSRPWDDLFGVWGRVRPQQNYRGGNPFKPANGGVWELAARYSTLDLTDGTVDGGKVRDLTAGVNWYPNSTSKLQFNWVHSWVEDTGYANIWILRYQFAIQ